MAAATAIAMLALIEYLFFGVEVGRARARSGLKAPAVTGDEGFERAFRAHYNTLEQLIVFLPALYAAAYYLHELYAVAAGVAFLIGRALYFRSYIADPARRGPGMLITMAANVALVVGGLLGALLVAF
ncbi:MAG: MAPEG family protein [Gammaproteobacteria bacterium]|nr:MAPEG family protein [Gammaproteobacteria bacterium]